MDSDAQLKFVVLEVGDDKILTGLDEINRQPGYLNTMSVSIPTRDSTGNHVHAVDCFHLKIFLKCQNNNRTFKKENEEITSGSEILRCKAEE